MRLILPEPKHIGLNTALGSLEHPLLKGNVFAIHDQDARPLGSAKKYLVIPRSCTVRFGFNRKLVPFPIVFIETNSEVLCFDNGEPAKAGTTIYAIKENIMKCQRYYMKQIGDGYVPVTAVERNSQVEYGYSVAIDGPSAVIYDPAKYHPLGGKVRIETDAPVRFLDGTLDEAATNN